MINFVPGGAKLSVTFALMDYTILFRNAVNDLPLRTTTNVRIEAICREILILLNGTIDSRVPLLADRMTADKMPGITPTFWSSYPGMPPSVVNIGPIEITPISKFSVDTTSNLRSGLISKKLFVPPNYSLSFDIRPSYMLNDWSNILHYYEDNAPIGLGARMPGTFLCSCSDSSF